MSEKLSVNAIRAAIKEVDDEFENIDSECNFSQFLREEWDYHFGVDKQKDDNDTLKRYLIALEQKLGERLKLVESSRTSGSGDFDGWEWLIKLGDRYFRVDGYYSSWEGYDCDDYYDLNEVRPVQKTITVYEPIN